MFLTSKSDENKLTNPNQIRIQQRCDWQQNHFSHDIFVSFSNSVSMVKLHTGTFEIYNVNDDFVFLYQSKIDFLVTVITS